MRLFTLAFLCGVLLLQQFTFLPAKCWIVIILSIIFILEIFFTQKYRYLKYCSAVLLGFSWTLFYVHMHSAFQLPKEMEGKPMRVMGAIASIPALGQHGVSFLFSLKNPDAMIKLSAHDETLNNLRAGDQWQFWVKLKRIHGMQNPGGFDYEAWALQEGIRASGYVVTSKDNRLLASHGYQGTLNRIRQTLKDKMEANLPKSNTSPWIIALALGERQNISAENWEVLRNTGTNHLMAIAGLHIGCMSGLMFAFVSFFWRRFPKLLHFFPAQFAGSVAALIMAVLYSALAGFSIPATRTAIMLSVVLLTFIFQRTVVSWHAFFIALLAALIINPLCVLTDSFWLSFGTVALIIYGISGRLHPHTLWWKLGRIQWVIAVGLIPVSIWLFQQFSFISFVANSLAIPVVAFIIVPLILFGCFVLIFSATMGGLILMGADKILALLWHVLTVLSQLHWATVYLMMPNLVILLAACLGIVILLLPAGFKGKWLGVVWCLPLIFYQYPAPRPGEIQFSLLDVGQGLSSVIQTTHHVLVFDTGPKFGANYDMGESVVAPFLRSIGIKNIDMLVISHPDNDHIGGAKSLFHYFKILQTKTSTPDELRPFPSSYCLRGDSWQWDGVTFQFLYPTRDTLDLDNDSSCVLRVTNAAHKSLLLTGDIEKFAENNLVQTESNTLAADILIAPHHGSKTSAVDSFVAAVHPQYVLFPVGYRNRYHFPNASVIEKYQEIHAHLFSTDSSGAIQFTLGESVSMPMQYRRVRQHYWSAS